MTHEHSWLNREQNTSLCHCGTEHIEGWEPEGCKWHFWWNGDIYIKWKLLMSSFYRQKYWHPWVYKFTPPPPKKSFVIFVFFHVITLFRPAVFNSSPRAPPLCTFCMSLLFKTHLIQIISSLEESSMNELCSDWHAPYTVFIAPYSLSMRNPLTFTSLRNLFIHGFALHQRHHTQTKLTSEVWQNIPL